MADARASRAREETHGSSTLPPGTNLMKIIKYNKLIRDKIPKIIKHDNAVPKISILNHKDFIIELKKKLIEESTELQNAGDKKEILNELSDVLEIIQTIARVEKN